MKKLFGLAGGIVEPGGGADGTVSAFVAYNPRPGKSRLFRVRGSVASPGVTELPSATTVDIAQFRRELEDELRPEVERIEKAGGAAAIAEPRAEWVAQVVGQHLHRTEATELD
jgi:hypothetical protein